MDRRGDFFESWNELDLPYQFLGPTMDPVGCGRRLEHHMEFKSNHSDHPENHSTSYSQLRYSTSPPCPPRERRHCDQTNLLLKIRHAVVLDRATNLPKAHSIPESSNLGTFLGRTWHFSVM